MNIEQGNDVEIAVEHVVTILGYMSMPFFALFAWFGKRLYNRVDRLERQFAHLDKTHAVQQAQLADIKEDISSIDKKINRILDKLR